MIKTYKKNKGSTLIELIGAMAILAIFLTGLSSATTYSIQSWKRGQVILTTNSYSKSIVEIIKANDERMINSLFENYGDKVTPTKSCEIQFTYSNLDSLKQGLEQLVNKSYIVKTNDKFHAAITLSKNNNDNDEFVDSLIKYSVYRVKIKIFDIKYGNSLTSTFAYDYSLLDTGK